LNVAGKIVWITGASSGIGAALSHQMYNKGATVVLSARRTEELHKIAAGFQDASRYMILPFDLEASARFRDHVAAVMARFGRIDILVNNGGISQRANARETEESVDRKIMEINYFSNILLTKAVLPEMRGQMLGKIVVISSIAGKFGFYQRSGYSASKFALHGFYESLRLEEEDMGISVLMVCPGRVQTQISVHALTGSGNMHEGMDRAQAEGISATQCARDIIRGIEKESLEIYSGGRELLALKLKKWLPSLFRKVIRKQKPVSK
jgi:short-subunit dehydrogenase